LGQSTWNVSASAIAALTNPNIDFYFMLDSSPSMAIAATQAGINTMVAATPAQAGCAFGCHEVDPSADNLGNPGCVANQQKAACEDNYALARSLGVTLRIDLINQAVQNLMTTAQSAETTYKANYRMALYNFDTTNHTLQALTSNLATAQASAAKLALLEVYTQSCVTVCPPQSGNNNDEDTNLDGAMSFINTTMPNAGFGSSIPSDSPQEVLFLITDGVEDYVNNGNRYISTINTAFCDSIKARGIRIAVLYTQYLPLPTNAFYNQNVAPFQSNIQPTLQSCATPGLFQTVQVGGSINSALSGLFATALETAQLVQ
jgi:hypothetical protein